MKQVCEIYDKVFKEKAIQVSYERTNISEFVRELGVTTPQLLNLKSLPTYSLKTILRTLMKESIYFNVIKIIKNEKPCFLTKRPTEDITELKILETLIDIL